MSLEAQSVGRLELPQGHILVVVANIQMRTLKAEVEKALRLTIFRERQRNG